MLRPLIIAGVWIMAVLAAVAAVTWAGWWTVPAAVLAGLAALGTWICCRPGTPSCGCKASADHFR